MRDDLVRLRRRAAGEVRRRSRYGFDLDARGRRRRGASARTSRASSASRRTTFVDRLGRAADRDQAAARPRPHDRARVDGRASSCWPATASCAPSVEQLAARARRRRPRAAARLRRRHRARGTRAFDAFLLTSANEGAPVVAIEALAAGVPVVATDAGRHAHGRRRRRDRVPRAGRRRRGARGAAATSCATTPSCAQRSAPTGATRMRERFSTERMVDDVERALRRDPRRDEGAAHDEGAGDRRRRAASARAAAGAARARHRRALPLARRRRRRRAIPPGARRARRPVDARSAAASTSRRGSRRRRRAPCARSGPTCCTRTWCTPTSTARSRRTLLRTPFVSTRHNDDRYLLGPFRYVDRAFMHGVRRDHRDLGCGARVPHPRRPAGGEARDDPLRARRRCRAAPSELTPADAGDPARARRSCSRSAA